MSTSLVKIWFQCVFGPRETQGLPSSPGCTSTLWVRPVRDAARAERGSKSAGIGGSVLKLATNVFIAQMKPGWHLW